MGLRAGLVVGWTTGCTKGAAGRAVYADPTRLKETMTEKLRLKKRVGPCVLKTLEPIIHSVLIRASTKAAMAALMLTVVSFAWVPSNVVSSRVSSIFCFDTILEVETKNKHKLYMKTLVQGEKSWCRCFLLFSYE